MVSAHEATVHEKCQREPTCQICDGGLYLCKICGALEGGLAMECPGRQLSYDEVDQTYKGEFVKGSGNMPCHVGEIYTKESLMKKLLVPEPA